MDIDRYLRVKQVSEITGLSRASIYHMEKIGSFPKKIVLGQRAVAWRESEICSWMDSRKAITKEGREAKPGWPRKEPEKTKKISRVVSDKNTGEKPVPLVTEPQSPLTITETIDQLWDDDSQHIPESLRNYTTEKLKRARGKAQGR